MVCYLCHDNTDEPLINCKNKLCKAYFHKTCWEKYLKINTLNNSICKVCYSGKIDIHHKHDGEVMMCDCATFFKKLF